MIEILQKLTKNGYTALYYKNFGNLDATLQIFALSVKKSVSSLHSKHLSSIGRTVLIRKSRRGEELAVPILPKRLLRSLKYIFLPALRMTRKQRPSMVKPIFSSPWTLRSSAEHSRTEVTWLSLNHGIVFLWDSGIPTFTTSGEWEREEILCRLIPPWNIASRLSKKRLQQTMWCASSGPVSLTVWTKNFFVFGFSSEGTTVQSISSCHP